MGKLSRSVVIGVALATLVSGCDPTPHEDVSPTPSATPTGSAAAPPAPTLATTPPADPLVLSVDGIGPYRIGARSADLDAAGLLGSSTPIGGGACPDLYSVAATGRYAGTLLLTVRHTVLIEISTAGGEPIRSPEGARVGATLEEVQTLYGTRGTMRTNPAGLRGFIVPVGDRVMLFTGHPIRPGVGLYAVGMANHTQDNFLTGDSC